MKLVCKIIFIPFIASLILLSCKSDKKDDVKHKYEIKNFYPKDSRQKNAITYSEMASMFKEYDNIQRIVLNKYIAKNTKGRDSIATVSQFFSISELKQYLAYIEKLPKEKEINLTGIRIFTSAYPSDYKIKEYRNRVSFILAPTTNIGDKENVAYEPLKSEINKPVSMQSILNRYADKTTKTVNRGAVFSVNFFQKELESSALNRGHMYQPY